jgi:hypothetical protein
MMHTEKEAQKIWCPAARLGDSCVASKCMAWRWAQIPNPDWKPDHGMMSTFGRDTRNDAPMYIDDKKRGYCGLGGRP